MLRVAAGCSTVSDSQGGVRTSTSECQPFACKPPTTYPDFNHIVVAGTDVGLHIYGMPTGKHLAGAKSRGNMPWFTLEGYEVWCCAAAGTGEGWGKVRRVQSHQAGLSTQQGTHLEGSPGNHLAATRLRMTVGFSAPWEAALVVVSSWRSSETDGAWGGRFLALLHPELPKVIVFGVATGVAYDYCFIFSCIPFPSSTMDCV